MSEIVLVDGRGRIVTDAQGTVRIWATMRQAIRDADVLSRKLKIRLKPRIHTGARWMRTVPRRERIEWG